MANIDAECTGTAVDAPVGSLSELQQQLESSSTKAESYPLNRFNLNVIAREKVNEILTQAVEETIAALASYAQKEESQIEDNYNNFTMRCNEKVFCAEKVVIPVGNSVESLDGNNDGEEGEEENECGATEELSINNKQAIATLVDDDDDCLTRKLAGDEEEEDGTELRNEIVTHLTNNELDRDEIDASTGNYLSSPSNTFTGESPRWCSNAIKDTDGNSVTDVKGFGVSAGSAGSSSDCAEMIQMTPDILIKNISVTAELGAIVSLSVAATNTTNNNNHHNVTATTAASCSMENHESGKRINCILGYDSFEPDLLRNIAETVEEEQQRRRRYRYARGEQEEEDEEGATNESFERRRKNASESDNKLPFRETTTSDHDENQEQKKDNQDQDEGGDNDGDDREDEELDEGNSISTTANGLEATIVMQNQNKTSNDILEDEEHQLKKGCTTLSHCDTLGSSNEGETNNLNNNGIFRHSYTGEASQEGAAAATELLPDRVASHGSNDEEYTGVAAAAAADETTNGDGDAKQRPFEKDVNEEEGEEVTLVHLSGEKENGDGEDINVSSCGSSSDGENNLDFAEEGSAVGAALSLSSSSSSSSDVMIAAMFNGTLWNSSPIDIVGDFGGEIERELGLITSIRSSGSDSHRNLSRAMSSNYAAAADPAGAMNNPNEDKTAGDESGDDSGAVSLNKVSAYLHALFGLL